jgi:hypothetical protein
VAEQCAEWGIFTEPRSWSSLTMERSRYETFPVLYIPLAFRNTGFCWFPPDADPDPNTRQEEINDKFHVLNTSVPDPGSGAVLTSGSGMG